MNFKRLTGHLCIPDLRSIHIWDPDSRKLDDLACNAARVLAELPPDRVDAIIVVGLCWPSCTRQEIRFDVHFSGTHVGCRRRRGRYGGKDLASLDIPDMVAL